MRSAKASSTGKASCGSSKMDGAWLDACALRPSPTLFELRAPNELRSHPKLPIQPHNTSNTPRHRPTLGRSHVWQGFGPKAAGEKRTCEFGLAESNNSPCCHHRLRRRQVSVANPDMCATVP